MNRSSTFSTILNLALLTIVFPGYSQKKQSKTQPPNIIVILTDDMGFSDVGTFGGKFVPTPNIDRIAKNGIKTQPIL
jgi:hypothetical protein